MEVVAGRIEWKWWLEDVESCDGGGASKTSMEVVQGLDKHAWCEYSV